MPQTSPPVEGEGTLAGPKTDGNKRLHAARASQNGLSSFVRDDPTTLSRSS